MSSPALRSIVSFSVRKTKEILFPFRFKRWLKILFIVWLAGHISGGSNFNIPNRGTPPAEEQQAAPAQQSSQTTTSAIPSSPDATPAPADSGAAVVADGGAAVVADGGGLAPLFFIPILLITLPLMFLFMWLSARFNFIFLDVMTGSAAVVADGRETGIGASFRAHKEIGNAYFRWSLLFLLCILGVLLALGLLVWLAVVTGGVIKILFGILAALLALSALLGIAAIAIFVTDFSLPIMYQERIPTSAAIDKFFSLRPRLGDLAFYFLVKLGLGIAAGIVGVILTLIALLTVGLAVALVTLGGFLLAGILPVLKSVLLIIGVILLIPAVIALVIAIGFVNLPIAVFFRALALTYLNRLVPQYNLLNFSSETHS